MTRYRSRNNKSKGILAGIICAILIVVTIGGVMSLFGGNDNTIDLKFSVGGLSDEGTYVKSDSTIYTKESFECSELVKVTRDFDANIEYQVFFYDDADEFVSSSDVYSKSADIVVPEGASRARIEITPIWSSDVDESDRVIK